MMPEIKNIELARIRLDQQTQPRCEIDARLVDEYRLEMKQGTKMPPVVVFFDGCDHWLADGYHRYQAAKETDAEQIGAEVHQGGLRDAILHAVGSNAAHGKRRSNADKRKAVTTLLQDAEWRQWSDRELARRCAVGKTMVLELRHSLVGKTSDAEHGTQERSYTTKHGTVAAMKTANIGKKQKTPEQSERERVNRMQREHKKKGAAAYAAIDTLRDSLAEFIAVDRTTAKAIDTIAKRMAKWFPR